jgi:hypothetical protein
MVSCQEQHPAIIPVGDTHWWFRQVQPIGAGVGNVYYIL